MRTRLVSRVGSLLAVGALLFIAQPAMAQQEPTTVDELTIKANPQSEKEVIEKFVTDTSVKTGTGQIGRWDRQICVGFRNIKPEAGEIIKAQVELRATQVGLAIAPLGCEPNIIVLATSDAKGDLKKEVKVSKASFLGNEWTMSQGKGKLKEFVNSDSPVRWWFLTSRVTWDGKPYTAGSIVEAQSFSRAAVRADFHHVFVVLDVSRIRTVDFSALADYIAFVSLAQTKPDAKVPPQVQSILTLFSDRDEGITPPTSLTKWDLSYLAGLYDARRDTKRWTGQMWDIRRSMQADQVSYKQE